ncbi:flagellar hook-basal body complex protein [Aliarcobacter lanthieri]|uniref:flagellar hook-basal body complex protein n=1 Tax=Aliarcobacter lanthieri TaxID=1355374 RepID=UPI0009DDFAC6|nr:flagellar hook-basal body complex protein [Aliarcobacter lanthieri]QKF58827.1 FlgEFG_subfam and FlgG domain-containing protein [Aliarcobacter lanthieri]
MIGALWTGISGLASHQTALDNESNNIANVNTVGYKSGRVSFADQVYQNSIGKGSFVQDAEKLFEQGSMKITGAAYDVMLQGDGFFKVKNKNTLGTAETFYTRAGNLRMGESGTLQTADGYEVQGWAMSKIDSKNDVKSTNHNISRFTDDYIKNIGSTIIRHKDYIETIAAKSTNFSETAKSDAVAVFNGAGQKSKASKLKDISLAQENYNKWLQKYQEDPEALSKGSSSQISQVNFRTGLPPTSLIGKQGDSIEVTIDGNVYNQPFVLTKTTETYRQEIWNSLGTDERTLHNLVDPATIDSLPSLDQETAISYYDKVAGKIETYKALADKISNSGNGGLVAYMAKNTTDPTSDILDINAQYDESTKISDMLQGVIQIESLIPGQEFKITSVSEILGGTKTTVRGTFQSTALAIEGSGKAALENARDALSQLLSGKQQSVYTTQDLYGSAGVPGNAFTFTIDIYDKDLEQIIPVPNDGNTPPNAMPITIPAGSTIEQIAQAINNSTTTTGVQLGDYITAKVLNDKYLVIETNDKNYDIEFDPKIIVTPTVSLNTLVDNTSYQYTIDAGSGKTVTIPFNVGNTVSGSMANIYQDFQTAIDNFNTDPNNVGFELELGAMDTNGNFTITSLKERKLESNLAITTPSNIINTLNTTPVNNGPLYKTDLPRGDFQITTTEQWNTTYSFSFAGRTITYTTPPYTGTVVPTPAYSGGITDIRDNLISRISADTVLSNLITVTAGGADTISINQVRIQAPFDPVNTTQFLTPITVSGSGSFTNDLVAMDPITGIWYPYDVGDPQGIDFELNLGANKSKTEVSLTLDGIPLTITTSENATASEIASKLQAELDKNSNLSARYKISISGTDTIRVSEKAGETGYTQFTNTPAITYAALPVPEWPLDKKFIEVNPDYSGRKGAGAEFMEITTRVDQSSTHDSLQLRLDKLDISDSKFGSFRVDETGLITIKDGGVEYAVGQLAIARFTNNRGLEAVGNNNFKATQESGNAIFSTNNNNTSGVKGQALELSKADLSESLVNLMVFQRAFEANAKSITTSDELLSTLINLKR